MGEDQLTKSNELQNEEVLNAEQADASFTKMGIESEQVQEKLAQGDGVSVDINVEFPFSKLTDINGTVEFYLPQNTSPVFNSGGSAYKIYKLDGDNHQVAIFESSGHTNNISRYLASGFYRVKFDLGQSSTNGNAISYTMKLYSPSASFYNDAGQLVMSTTPMGFQKLHELVPNSSSNTTNVDLSEVDKTEYTYYGLLCTNRANVAWIIIVTFYNVKLK